MDSLLTSAADFIARNAMWAGVILGVVTFFESLVVIGAFVPATGLLVAAGGLVAAGVLDPFTVIGGCVIGAVMGDAISYWIGRRLGTRVLRHHMLVPHRRKLAWTRLYCRRYGVASIFIGLLAFGAVVVALVVAMRWLKGRAARRNALLEASVRGLGE